MERQLAFRPDGTFTIAQFTDIHWQNGDALDQKSRALMEQVLESEQPDLVVFTGDMIESLRCTDPVRSLRQVVAVAEERQIPWAAVFGNHDSEKGSRQKLGQALRESTYGLFDLGPPEIHGVGNYHLPVRGSADPESAAILWFFDSGSYAPIRIAGYEWIHRDQITWYRRRSAAITAAAGTPLPSLAFFHIPLLEYSKVWRRAICRGNKQERVCCPWLNSGLFRAMRQMGDIMATFCGHDHVNDYAGELCGIRLCYGRATGYNTYGRDGFARGARLIRLREGQRRHETWLRLDGGLVVTRQPVHLPGSR